MSVQRRISVAGVVAVLGLALASCGGPGNPGASSSTTTTKATVPGSVPLRVPNEAAARKNVQLINCNAVKGGWTAGGTVHNPTDQPATYLITVYFTSSQATDLAYAQTSVALDPGQTRLWSAKASFDAPSVVLCVLRGVATH